MKRTLLAGVAAGAAAGLAMAAVEMIYGWASSAHTAWGAPMGIWAYIGGLNHFGRPVDHIGPIVLGIGGHMLNAILVGIVFVELLRLLRKPPGCSCSAPRMVPPVGAAAVRVPADQHARGQAVYHRHDQSAVGLVDRTPRPRGDDRPHLPAARAAPARHGAAERAADARAACREGRVAPSTS